MENTFAFKPLKIPYGKNGKILEFKNRYMIPPMVTWVAEKDGLMTSFHNARYQSFAMGNFGSIIMEATAVDPNGRISQGDLGIWSDDHIPGLKSLVEDIHKPFYKGTKIGIQLAHAGRKASSSVPWTGFYHIPESKGGLKICSCSPLAFDTKSSVPHELTNQEVKEMVQKFIDAAVRVKKCGFDFLELHGAHGYLINQFLCSSSNKRTDEYGGPFENRIRFLLEIVDGIFKVLGEFPIFVRMSCDEGERKGKKGDNEYNKTIEKENEKRWTIEDTANLAEILLQKGVVAVDCSYGSVNCDQIWNTFSCHQVKYSEALKKRFGNRIVTTCVGEISTAEHVEDILKNGKGDLIQLGRQALINPYTPFLHAMQMKVPKEEIAKQYVIQHGYAIERLYARQKKE